MKIYVYSNGAMSGPFHRDELIGRNITPQTPVWYSGLSDWTPAGRAEHTRWLFDPTLQEEIRRREQQMRGQRQGSAGAPPPPNPPYGQAPYGQQQPYGQPYGPQQPYGQPYGPQPPYGQQPPQYNGYRAPNNSGRPRPNSYMVYSILVLVLFLSPFAIVGTVYSSRVNDLYARGQVDEAYRASSTACTWDTIGLVLGLLCCFFYSGIWLLPLL